jgi:hypothetical protein
MGGVFPKVAAAGPPEMVGVFPKVAAAGPPEMVGVFPKVAAAGPPEMAGVFPKVAAAGPPEMVGVFPKVAAAGPPEIPLGSLLKKMVAESQGFPLREKSQAYRKSPTELSWLILTSVTPEIQKPTLCTTYEYAEVSLRTSYDSFPSWPPSHGPYECLLTPFLLRAEVVKLKHSTLSSFREFQLAIQGGRCLVTGRPLDLSVAVVDHSHSRNQHDPNRWRVRGVIHRMVNFMIPERQCTRAGVPVSELPKLLRQIADYLERPTLLFLYPEKEPLKVVMLSSYNELARAITAAGEPLPKWWGYRYQGKKKVQRLTKPLLRLYTKLGIEPKFYTS